MIYYGYLYSVWHPLMHMACNLTSAPVQSPRGIRDNRKHRIGTSSREKRAHSRLGQVSSRSATHSTWLLPPLLWWPIRMHVICRCKPALGFCMLANFEWSFRRSDRMTQVIDPEAHDQQQAARLFVLTADRFTLDLMFGHGHSHAQSRLQLKYQIAHDD
jgi:hypothetical protein